MELELVCIGCGKKPEDIAEYVELACVTKEDYDELIAGPRERLVEAAREACYENEGTLNTCTGDFTCTDCYIKLGTPSHPNGWVAGFPF